MIHYLLAGPPAIPHETQHARAQNGNDPWGKAFEHGGWAMVQNVAEEVEKRSHIDVSTAELRTCRVIGPI